MKLLSGPRPKYPVYFIGVCIDELPMAVVSCWPFTIPFAWLSRVIDASAAAWMSCATAGAEIAIAARPAGEGGKPKAG